MDKRFIKYFGKNISRKIYLTGIAVIAIGAVVAYAYWVGYGVPLMAVGVLLFFIGSANQVSDKDIDEKLASSVKEYAEKNIDGKTLGKNILKGQDFSVFGGFIREGGNVRFKVCKDGKVRTSSYFITAVACDKKQFTVFTTVYDLLSPEEPKTQMLTLSQGEEIQFTKTPLEFPKGNFKCRIIAACDGNARELDFFITDDALADKLLSKLDNFI